MLCFNTSGGRRFVAGLGGLWLILSIYGQADSCSFAGLVEKLEEQYNIRFYYREEWVAGVKVSTSGDSLDLDRILSDALGNKGLNYFMEDRRVYVYPGNVIVCDLPAYEEALPDFTREGARTDMSQTERLYMEGRRVAETTVLEVGDRQKAGGPGRCIVNGVIFDASNGEPLIGATIYIEELGVGAASDVEGRFRLVLEPGKYRAVFNYVSMKGQEYILRVYSSGSIRVELKKELVEIGEVKISARRRDNVRGIEMGFERISARAMKEIPVVFGEKDILKVAQLLPGIQSVGEGASGFNVRGSPADQNMFYINRVPVYNTSHVFGFFTSFNPDIISDFSLYKSNVPARYGGRLASIFEISTRQGSKKRVFGQGGISPISAHASLELPLLRDKVTLVGSWRQSYSDWILKRINDKDIRKSNASFYDGTLALNVEINDKNLLRGFAYLSRDRFSLSSISDFDYGNAGTSLIWKHLFSPALSSDVSLIYSRYSFENINKTNLSKAYVQDYGIDHYEGRVDMTLITSSNHKLEFGLGSILYGLNRGNILPFGEASWRVPVSFGKEEGLESAIYFSDAFTLFNRLNVRAGLRYSYFRLLGPAEINQYDPAHIRIPGNIIGTRVYPRGESPANYSGPEYRLALSYYLGRNNSVKASYNRIYQYIFMLSNTIAISPSDSWKLCDYHIRPPVMDQLSLGYFQDFREGGIETSVELYYKWIKNQVEYRDGADFTSPDPIETIILQGRQDASGIELMIRKNLGKTTGWLSYCYARSFVLVDAPEEENRINYGLRYPSNYDRPNSLNLVLNHRVNRRLSLSTNFVYATGRPITYPVSVYYAEGQELLYFSRRNAYRIPDYIRMDISVNLEGNLNKKKPIHSFWVLSLYNALGRENTYSVYYTAENGKVHGEKLSIFARPILTLSWNYKFGNYMNE